MTDANTGQMVHKLAAATAEIVALKKENAALGVKMRALQWKILALEEAAERRFWAGFDLDIADANPGSLNVYVRWCVWRGEPWGCA